MKKLIFTIAIIISALFTAEAQGEASNLSVYPNPVQEHLYLHDTAGITSFMLIDQIGRTVKVDTYSEAGQTVKVNVANLPNGTYYVMVNAGTAKQSTKKFIKS